MIKIIIFGISILIIIGAVVYFAVQKFEPYSYAPEPQAASLQEEIGGEAPAAPTPQEPIPPPQTTGGLASRTAPVSRATSEEIKKYNEVLPRDISPATLKLNLLDVRVVSYKPNEVFIIERPSAFIPSSIWQFNQKTKILTPLIRNEYGLMRNWFAGGRYTLTFSASAAGGYSLAFADEKTNQRLPVRFTTLPDKCTVTGDTPIIYCGVPKTLPQGTVLPDDYLKRKFYSDDKIMMIDIDKSSVRELSDEKTPVIDIYNPVVIDNALFFLNRRDEKIYKLPL